MSTSNQQGDANEAYFQRYIEEIYAAAHPQFIENTEYDSVHGIDKAFVMNNYKQLCIAEVKSQYSQLGKGQMSKQWIIERLQKLQQQDANHPLIIAIEKVLANNGEVYARNYRVNENNSDKKPLQFTKGYEYFIASELKEILNKTAQSSFTNSTKEASQMGVLSTGNRSVQFHLDSLETLDQFERKLQQFKENLESELQQLETFYSQLADENRWNDIKHAEYGENYIEPIQQQIQQIKNLLENESMPFIQRYRAKAEDLGVTY